LNFENAARTALFDFVIRKWIFRILKLALGVFGLTTLLAIIAYIFPQEILTVDSGAMKADVMVVLGGGLHERPERAAELFKADDAPRIIVSGLGDDEINRRLLVNAGVPAKLIQVEAKSHTTKENAEFTIKLLREQKVKRVIIVTSWYHSRRALATFEHFAPEIKFYSRPSYFAFKRPDWPATGMAKRVYLEYLKMPGYWVRYGVWPF
jgi:uncharacterized SAM-binding protein YcdF (DUF218 family)